uniref:Uncharacterized protein n=1 Tax=Rhizophora mucronata TaxID=61149 RepID=A0A2P2Q0G9_RHIMU
MVASSIPTKEERLISCPSQIMKMGIDFSKQQRNEDKKNLATIFKVLGSNLRKGVGGLWGWSELYLLYNL